MTPAEEKIFEIFKQHGRFTLTWNKEYGEEMIYQDDGKIIFKFQEWLEPENNYEIEITPQEVVENIIKYFNDRRFDKNSEPEITTAEQALKVWLDMPYEY